MLLPSIGETCKFVFKTKYVSLNGIYKVTSKYTFEELVDQGIDLFKEVYDKIGLDQPTYEADYDSFKDVSFVKLQSVTDEENITYITKSFLEKNPDPNVYPYLELAFAVNIGVFDNVSKIEWIKDQIKQNLAKVTGEEIEPDLFDLTEKWMTTAEYKVIDDARQANISNISNHYMDKEALLKENAKLKTLVKYYEQTIINSQPQGG